MRSATRLSGGEAAGAERDRPDPPPVRETREVPDQLPLPGAAQQVVVARKLGGTFRVSSGGTTRAGMPRTDRANPRCS
ncbi:hypothetical protein ACFO9E_19505 [Streptomyces maoxianensis]|uniref:Uncharacterized protein n=1 Tax=Streptomyces maoxianensis TaxID=1459942 RepID=A0ABV9GA45_9ACTN